MSTSVALAEQLLDLVKNVSDSNYSDPLSTWQKRIEIQRTCDRLLADVLGPREYTVLLAESCQESQALGFANHYKVADIVGDNEVALADIAEQIQVQPKFLAVAMSCLLGRGYFEEVGGFGSHVYKNNQFSNIIRATHPSSVSDAVGFCTDEAFRATSRLTDAGKTDAEAPAISIAFGIEGGLFPVLNSEAYRVKRFGNAMQQLHGVANANVPADYDWHKLLSPIVDVGAGIGSLEIGLFKEETNRHLEFVIFDIPETIENSRKTWANHPSSSHISFISGSFLEPTLESSKLPPGAPTYIIRHVLHDWADDDVVRILNLVKQALLPSSRLLLVEVLLSEQSSRLVRTTSMQLLAVNSGSTRTEDAMKKLVEKAGLEIVGVHKMRAADCIMEVKTK